MFLFRAHSTANGSNENKNSIWNSHQWNAIELYRHLYISCYIFSVIHIRTVVNECGGHKERIITQLLFALFDAYKCKWETTTTNVFVRVNVLKNLWNVYNVLINVDFVLLCPPVLFFFSFLSFNLKWSIWNPFTKITSHALFNMTNRLNQITTTFFFYCFGLNGQF